MNLSRHACLVTLLTGSLGATASAQVNEAWVDRLDGPAGMNDYGEAITVAADGSVYVAGAVFEEVSENYFAPRFMTIRYDPGGARLWTRTYHGTFATGAAFAHHIAIDGDGNVLVSGSTNQGDDWAVLKYDPDGNELWRAVYETDSTYLTRPDGMAVDATGNVFLAGTVGDPVNPDSGTLVKFTRDGIEAWDEQYYGPTFDGGTFADVALDADGNAYAVGAAVVPGRAGELAVVKYGPDGGRDWVVTDGSSGQNTYDRATAVVVDDAGNVVATGGLGYNSAAGVDIVTLAIDPAGETLWRRVYVGPAGRTDAATAIATDAANAVVVVGYSGVTPGDYDAITLKYAADGSLQWERRVSGDEIYFDWATVVAVDANDNVYVAGEYDPIGGSRYFAVRYDPDGTESWFMSYAGPLGGGSRANAIAVGPAGSVCVTGDSPDVGSEFDIATIRYEQPVKVLPGDANGDGVVDFNDLLRLLAVWGVCSDCGNCPEDMNDDCGIGMPDLLVVLANWS